VPPRPAGRLRVARDAFLHTRPHDALEAGRRLGHRRVHERQRARDLVAHAPAVRARQQVRVDSPPLGCVAVPDEVFHELVFAWVPHNLSHLIPAL